MKFVRVLLLLTGAALGGCATPRANSLIEFHDATYPGALEFVQNGLPELLVERYPLERAGLSGLVQLSEVWRVRGKPGSEYDTITVTGLNYQGRLSVIIDSPRFTKNSKQVIELRTFTINRAGSLVLSSDVVEWTPDLPPKHQQ